MKKLKTSRKPQLSVVVLNYNSKELLLNCLDSLSKVRRELAFEIIVIDNCSTDGSVKTLKQKNKFYDVLIEAEENLGFAAGNNLSRDIVRGKHVLFLNPDTLVHAGTLKGCVGYLNKNKTLGAVTCRQILPNGKIDPDSRRRFPTLMNSIARLSGLSRLFQNSSVLNDYWYGGVPENSIQEIDVAQGAFFMIRRDLLEKVDWFDTDYFLNGEDIDLSWKIRKAGYKIVYNPEFSINHMKKGIKARSKSLRVELAGVNAMEIFYRKRLWGEHLLVTNYVALLGISVMKILRTTVFYISK